MSLSDIEQIIKETSEEYDNGKCGTVCRCKIDRQLDDYFVNKAIEEGEFIDHRLCSHTSTRHNGGRKG